MPPPYKPTMADVARIAGVSPMTVSRAMRPNESVSDETRKRVQDAADQLGYVIDSAAAGLSSRRSGFVAMTIPSINNGNFADTARGLTQGLRESGLELLLGYTDYDIAEEERLVEAFLRRRPEAIVLTGGAHSERCRALVQSSGIPVVETWDLPADPLGKVVGFSNAEAGAMVAHHFHDLGYRRIGFIGGASDRDTRGADRRSGFLRTLSAYGLDNSRVVTDEAPPISMREGANALDRLLDKWPDTEAVMCVSDLAAFGAQCAAIRRNLAIPDDLAIAGFGAYELAEHALPPLTTIHAKAIEIGNVTARIICNLLGHSDAPDMPDLIRIETVLLQRSSTKTRRDV